MTENTQRMENEKTIEQRYQELIEIVPDYIREEFQRIEKGEILPQMYSDRGVKKILDPDIHPQRLSRLLELIFLEEMKVEGSLKEESVKASIYSKKTIVDILARLENRGIVDAEMQVAAQEFIVNRMNVYTSDIIMLQYSVKEGEKKVKMDFSKIPMSYGVVFMKESPSIFKENESFIHYKKDCTDTGIELPMLSKLVYIELDKCYQMVQENSYPEEKEELCRWLAFIADVNSDYARNLAEDREEFKKIRQELKDMSKSKEEMLAMLADKYDESIRFSELEEARRDGEVRGEARGSKNGIKIGEDKMAKLTKILLNEKRYDDLAKSTEDEKYRDLLYKEFGI